MLNVVPKPFGFSGADSLPGFLTRAFEPDEKGLSQGGKGVSMNFLRRLKSESLTIGMFLLVSAPLLLLTSPTLSFGADEMPTLDWNYITPEGFGDPDNNLAWSMQWWNGKLFVGTNRSWFCTSIASSARKVLFPLLAWLYPPTDPDMECAEAWEDMSLQAEIWRWTPETNVWDLVYRSPADVPNTTYPGKFSAREVGFRGMGLFTDPDGTEAMYVTSTWSGMVNDGATPPRILRSTDGETFLPVPQDPGTFLGDFNKSSMRGILTYDDRFFVIAGTIQGQGALWEADDPSGGNDNFRQVSPVGISIWDFNTFNGYLYVGIREESPAFQPKSGRAGSDAKDEIELGYSVAKTLAVGDPPYTFETVIPKGAYLPEPSQTIVSIVPHEGLLYVGCDKPAEMIRIYPDDSWDLVVGTPRDSPDGWKYPLSGMDAGFGVSSNVHIWRMQVHRGILYAGTMDQTTRLRKYELYEEAVKNWGGFDLYRTQDGWFWQPLTTTGFGEMFQSGIRTFASTPYGIFFGSNNFWGGCRVYRGVGPGDIGYTGYSTSAPGARKKTPLAPPPPGRLQIEASGGSAVLSWDTVAGASRYRVYRADFIEGIKPDEWVPGPYEEIGSTRNFYYVDNTVPSDDRSLYVVKAEFEKLGLSDPSNYVPYPFLAPVQTLSDLKERVKTMSAGGKFVSSRWERSFLEEIDALQSPLAPGKIESAVNRLTRLQQTLEERGSEVLDGPYVRSMEVRFSKLLRRLRLAQAGVIEPVTTY